MEFVLFVFCLIFDWFSVFRIELLVVNNVEHSLHPSVMNIEVGS
jgi:hypothetical protein